MWVYEKKLQYPVKITRSNPALAKIIITQYGGPDGNRIEYHTIFKPDHNRGRPGNKQPNAHWLYHIQFSQ